MQNTPSEIFKIYKKSAEYKASLGSKGMFEQNRINERFFNSDQWHGAYSSGERPLVRHNIIKRIGDYKMGLLSNQQADIRFFAEGVPDTPEITNKTKTIKKEFSLGQRNNMQDISKNEKNSLLCDMISNYYKFALKKLNMDQKLALLLSKSFITGTGVLYSYWAAGSDTLGGDVQCEVLNCENICFGDNTIKDIQSQPFIIVAARKNVEELKKQALVFGADKNTVSLIKEDVVSSGKATVLTKFFKEYKKNGKVSVKAVCVCEKSVIRPEFDTGLSLYPINIFAWQQKDGRVFGESEVTHLIPNQIAINRMITAQVWAAMSMGMPIMTVNGDTVSGEITNDPGQIIKVYGSNEDVAGAIHYVTPPDFSDNFERCINSLVNNTLESSGASGLLYSNLPYNNTAAVSALKESTDISLKMLKNRYKAFLSEVALVWLDFLISKYSNREICIEDENGRWFFPFDAEALKDFKFSATICKNETKEENYDG